MSIYFHAFRKWTNISDANDFPNEIDGITFEMPPTADTASSVFTATSTTSSCNDGAPSGGPGAGKGGGGVGTKTGGSAMSSMPPLKKKTTIVKASVPPPVPPRGSPKMGKMKGGGPGATGSLPSQSSSGYRGRSSAGKVSRRQPKPYSSPTRKLEVLSENISDYTRSPNKVLSWLSNHDFRVAENGEHLNEVPVVDELENQGPTQKPPISSEVRKIAQNFECSSSGVTNSLSSVKRMTETFEKHCSVERSESVKERIKQFSLLNEPVSVPLLKRHSFAAQKIQEKPTVDANNNLEKFVPMAERIQEYKAEQNDELVLSKLQNLVQNRRQLFASPNSTTERPIKVQKKLSMGNGSLGKQQAPVRQKRTANKALKPDEILRKIADIEQEIRENEARLQTIPEPVVNLNYKLALESLPHQQDGKVLKNDSFLCRLKPKPHPPSGELHTPEKVAVLRELGLPLDEQHNLDSYLSQFSLEGEFV